MVSALGLKPNDFVALSAGKLGAAQKTAGTLVKTLAPPSPVTWTRSSTPSAGLWTSPCTRSARSPGFWSSATTPSPCPNGGLEILKKAAAGEVDPLSITAFQYDLVCNGVELSSGAVRNHDPEIMIEPSSSSAWARTT